jgi:hypothetical protein
MGTATRWTGAAYLYFDIRDERYTRRDLHGVAVSDMAEAWRTASEMILKLRQVDPPVAQGWIGWTLTVVDPAGAVVFTTNLAAVL